MSSMSNTLPLLPLASATIPATVAIEGVLVPPPLNISSAVPRADFDRYVEASVTEIAQDGTRAVFSKGRLMADRFLSLGELCGLGAMATVGVGTALTLRYDNPVPMAISVGACFAFLFATIPTTIVRFYRALSRFESGEASSSLSSFDDLDKRAWEIRESLCDLFHAGMEPQSYQDKRRELTDILVQMRRVYDSSPQKNLWGNVWARYFYRTDELGSRGFDPKESFSDMARMVICMNAYAHFLGSLSDAPPQPQVVTYRGTGVRVRYDENPNSPRGEAIEMVATAPSLNAAKGYR